MLFLYKVHFPFEEPNFVKVQVKPNLGFIEGTGSVKQTQIRIQISIRLELADNFKQEAAYCLSAA
jgi:hypothetical protein